MFCITKLYKYLNYTNIGLIWYINFSKYLISFNQSLLVYFLININI